MRKKTALQQLIDIIKSSKQEVDIQGVGICEVLDYHGIEDKATELLETEREDHEKTYYDAFVASDGTRLKVDFDEYYKETYG